MFSLLNLWCVAQNRDEFMTQVMENIGREKKSKPPCNLNRLQQIVQVARLPLFGSQSSKNCNSIYQTWVTSGHYMPWWVKINNNIATSSDVTLLGMHLSNPITGCKAPARRTSFFMFGEEWTRFPITPTCIYLKIMLFCKNMKSKNLSLQSIKPNS